MPTSQNTKADMQRTLQEMGETPPSSWTKLQLKTRIEELKEAQPDIMTEKDAVKEINKCRTKAAVQALMDQHQIPYPKHANSDQLKAMLLKYYMENLVPQWGTASTQV